MVSTQQADTVPPNQSIVLVGMPGSGKSTLGRKLATRLERPFVDTDEWIEAQEGKTVPQIFDQEGAAYFREKERACLNQLLQGPPTVIASGGGLPAYHGNMEYIVQHALAVYLHTDLDELSHRLSSSTKQTERPLLRGGTAEAKKRLQELWQKRVPIYQNAHLRISTTKKSIEALVDELLNQMKSSYI